MAPTVITPMQRGLLLIVSAAFGILTAVAVWHHGYDGIFRYQIETWAGRQVLIDLVIVCTILIVWMWRDAKALGRNPWPWIALTLVAGSFGPLFYLITRKSSP